LGPTFVKLGQVLASRPDMLPPEWIEEFRKLHTHVTAVPFAEIRSQLEEDLGMRVSEAFTEFVEQPLAAGSIAQVHRARLMSGVAVAVKVRRPEIRAKVIADLRLLQRLADLLESEVSDLRRFRPRKVVRHFARTMRAELDLLIEAKNLQAVAHNLSDNDEIVLPEVVPRFTRERLLVMTLLEGEHVEAWLQHQARPGPATRSVARIGADAVLKMVLVDGLYHADPHPGNVLVLSGARVGLVDFGMVGRLSDTRRREFAALMIAIAERDEEAVTDVLLDWSDGGQVDVEQLTQDAQALLDRFQGVVLRDLDVTALLADIAEIVRENNLAFPADVSMLIKVFVSLEDLGRRLDPEFDMSAHLEPLARIMIRRLHSPWVLLRRGIRDSARVLAGLPHDIKSLVARARRGGMKLELDLERLDHFGRQLDRSANRITFGMVTAALIVGTSIAMTIDGGPTLWGLPAIGLLGFLSSALLGLGLLWSVLRSGRGR
ncbi:MAG: phosphotransferase, partial [Planctomycetes bacterium]|nr:phosphotransferase [Planctomycetota bacterium]